MPLRAAERLLERARAGRRAPRPRSRTRAPIDRPGVLGGVPRAERVHVGAAARHLAGQGQLDRPLDRRLAGLVRAVDDRQPGRERDLELAVAAEVAEVEPGDPHRVTSWPASSSRPRRRTSRSSAASPRRPVGAGRLELGDPALDVADERAGDRVGGRQDALGQGGQRQSRTRSLQEAALERAPRPRRVAGRARPGGRRSAGRRGRGPGSARAASARRAPAGRRPSPASRSSFSNRVLPTVRSSTVTVRVAVRLVELDEQDLARAVLVDRDRLRARRRRRTSSPPALPCCASASGRARGSRGRSPRSPRG